MKRKCFAMLLAMMLLSALTACKEDPAALPMPETPEKENVDDSTGQDQSAAHDSDNRGEEIPVFCNTWYTQATDGDGELRALELALLPDGTAEYGYGIPQGDILEAFEGSWHEADGVLTLELYGGAVNYEGSETSGDSYAVTASFEWDYQSRHLYMKHVGGGALLYYTEGATFDFLPFDSFTLAGTWVAQTEYRDWVYQLDLLENGECTLSVTEQGKQLVFYEGWWSDESGVISLDAGLASGQHPENPEMRYLDGTYQTEWYGNELILQYDSGEILTLDMEEYGFEEFSLRRSCCGVTAEYLQDTALVDGEYDWVIVDDTEPLDVAFMTQEGVQNFRVWSLLLQDVTEMGEPVFEVTELYAYGTLTSENPIVVTLTDYGTVPAYGVSFVDPDGVERFYSIGISGMDGSLELLEFVP